VSRRWRSLRTRRGDFFVVPPPLMAVAPPPGGISQASRGSRRVAYVRTRRGNFFGAPFPVTVITTQALPPTFNVSRRRLSLRTRHGNYFIVPFPVTVVTAQDLPPKFATSRRPSQARLRRGSYFGIPLVVALPPRFATSRRPAQFKPRRGSYFSVPPFIAPITTQALPPAAQRATRRPLLQRARRGSYFNVPLFVAPVVTQALPPTVQRATRRPPAIRSRRGQFFWSKPTVVTLTNNAEGGVDNAVVTTGNSGGISGTAWDAVLIGSGGAAITFDNTFGYGSMSYQMVSGTSNTNLSWSTSMGTLGEAWGRVYLYLPSLPIASTGLVRLVVGGAQVARITVSLTGSVELRNAANTKIGQTTAVTATGQWVRIEWHVIASATNGTIEVQLYNNADSITPDEVVSLTGAVLATNIDQVQYGPVNNVLAGTYWLDNIGITTAGWMGPVPPITPAFPSPLLRATRRPQSFRLRRGSYFSVLPTTQQPPTFQRSTRRIPYLKPRRGTYFSVPSIPTAPTAPTYPPQFVSRRRPPSSIPRRGCFYDVPFTVAPASPPSYPPQHIKRRRPICPTTRRGHFLATPSDVKPIPPRTRATPRPKPVCRRGKFLWIPPRVIAAGGPVLVPKYIRGKRASTIRLRRGRFLHVPLRRAGAAPPILHDGDILSTAFGTVTTTGTTSGTDTTAVTTAGTNTTTASTNGTNTTALNSATSPTTGTTAPSSETKSV
jgi:hypothetical protein